MNNAAKRCEDSKYFIQNQYFEQQIKSKDNIYLKPFLNFFLKVVT